MHAATPDGPLVVVDDLDDDRLTEYRDLNQPAVRRRLEAELGIIVVEGRVAVRQLLDSDVAVRSLLVDDHQVTLAVDLVTAVRALAATVFVVPRDRMADLVGFRLHRGVVAIATRPAVLDPGAVLAEAARTPSLDGGPPSVVVLEGLNDPENIGAVFRNAAAFGAGAVLLDPTSGDPLYRRCVRVSVGHVLHLPFARLDPWPAGLGRVRAAGFLVCALAPHPGHGAEGGPEQLTLRQLSGRRVPVALLLGAEGPGLSTAALESVDAVVTIPMAPGVDSLNVATAAAVALERLSGA
jgi:tRNA G18 (ribose-2'-O)-methylase SpoU